MKEKTKQWLYAMSVILPFIAIPAAYFVAVNIESFLPKSVVEGIKTAEEIEREKQTVYDFCLEKYDLNRDGRLNPSELELLKSK